ncbi:MAG: CYTH domain-containing protein [Elusimicrobiaceae bacterium]|nr:CYTH domain-containing protein [Elusimicrobiaceae bacterium]
MKHLEIECKWDANTPRAFARARQFVAQLNSKVIFQTLRIKDVYLDHANRDLSSQKIALRVRNTAGKWEATFKSRSEIKNGKAVRREETRPLPGVKNVRQALRLLAQQKKWKGINTTGLCAQFALVNKRQLCMFSYDGAQLEMALDDVTIYVAGRQVKFKEIEVELKSGKPTALENFAHAFSDATQLKPAQISKVKTAETFLKFWKK